MTRYWTLWALSSSALAAYLAWVLLMPDATRSAFLVGTTTSGHHQIELACESCHTTPFGGPDLLQKACETCHLEELQAVRDSHPRRKFTDPANADRVAVLDARLCVTCHREHRAELTQAMGVTLPDDVCFLCHENVGEERATHANLGFETCASSGCHNFHDNTALYESFLADNASIPPHRLPALVRTLTGTERILLARASARLPPAPDAPAEQLKDTAIVGGWASSAHAVSDVNCSNCHTSDATGWTAQPGLPVCETCHAFQTQGFLSGKHGMRIAAQLEPMTAAMAREPMRSDAPHAALSCSSCHDSHGADLRRAAVDACMGCHDSDHVRAYPGSPHAELSKSVLSGAAPVESAVTCATCHMPRESELSGGVQLTRVQHNQNLNLRPNDKMLRSVCLQCHGLAFAIDALADARLLANNFTGKPSVHIASIDMAVARRHGGGMQAGSAVNQSLGEQTQ
jgi:predicted CXXCH cytochrome family protein